METLESILLRALATAYKKAANHDDDVDKLAHFLGNMPDKSVISEVIKTVSVELTPEHIFQLIQATKDADYYHKAYLRETEAIDTWMDAYNKFRKEVLTPDAERGGRTKEERTIDAANKYLGKDASKKDRKHILKAALNEYDFITTDVSHAHGEAMPHQDAIKYIREKYGFKSTETAIWKALRRTRSLSKESE